MKMLILIIGLFATEVSYGSTDLHHHLDGRPGPYRVTCVMPEKEGN